MRTNFVCRIATPLFVSLALGFTQGAPAQQKSPSVVQVVALDECDPATFNGALGPDFCKNVTLGASTTISDLFAGAAAGNPDPGWDFEPDSANIKDGAILSVVDQGGEPHTFTEVEKIRRRFYCAPQCAGRGHGSRMCGRLQEHRRGEDAHSPGEPAADHESVERRTSVPVLHSSVDEIQSHGEVSALNASEKAVRLETLRFLAEPSLTNYCRNSCLAMKKTLAGRSASRRMK